MSKRHQMCDIECPYCQYECEKCGHNLAEIKYRKNLLETQGLTKGKDGLWQLVLPKKA